MMTIVDAHQHFWQYDPQRHAWISDEMAIIRQDFLPETMLPMLQECNVSATVAVQADQTEAETDWLLQLAADNTFIAGVVGWVDLCNDHLEERLEHYAGFPKLKGFRHILQAEDPTFMLQPSFLKGIGLLRQYGFTYDILIFPHKLDAALQLVGQFPDQPFVIDHLAKPFIKAGSIEAWTNQMQQMAMHENVCCKISGMVTEADWQYWKAADLRPYLDVVVDAFGTDRLMFGSDWPVCLVAAHYQQWMTVVREYFADYSAEQQAQVFGGNAIRFYHLDL